MYRSDSFDQNFNKRMKSIKFAQSYILALINDAHEPMSVTDALKFTIRRMGTTDFANLVDEKIQTIDKFLKGERNPKQETLNHYLRPFRLKIKISLEKLKVA